MKTSGGNRERNLNKVYLLGYKMVNTKAKNVLHVNEMIIFCDVAVKMSRNTKFETCQRYECVKHLMLIQQLRLGSIKCKIQMSYSIPDMKHFCSIRFSLNPRRISSFRARVKCHDKHCSSGSLQFQTFIRVTFFFARY